MRSPSLSLSVLLAALVWLLASPSSTVAAGRSGFTCRALKNPLSMASSTCICAPCHLCEFSFRRMQCQPMLQAGADVTDGSEIRPTQPSLDPESWFLTEAELTASRGRGPAPEPERVHERQRDPDVRRDERVLLVAVPGH
ncbi:hypothetical protein PINS_up021261 [Pythium insidiosum]|nr:hypothetical protein PINS_up021261 [Pythium insidiosum]